MSNNLNIAQVAESQAQKEVTINLQAGQLDAALTESLVLDFTADNVALTDDQFRRNVRFYCDNVTTGRTLTVPAIKHLFLVTTDPDNSATTTVKRGDTEFVMNPGSTSLFYADSTTDGLVQVAGGGGGSGAYNVGFSFMGEPGPSDVLVMHVFAETINFPEDLLNSVGHALVAPTATVEFEIHKNGALIGTAEIASAANIATFTLAGGETFAPGDILTVLAPNPADATLADVAFTLLGDR